ncbi:DUF2586 family protein [Ornithobacterium rhinotracheale]|uniref:DUF2586 family protein n=1 Tax=Ornithobacterium rhinotracheale TaxID=28251 RepID=UPI00129D1EAB|nr:DUF2586 family protein [Ornithobacterium rhinotracheale]MRI64425.1 DUF2586 family protein [Ornithobacterium rhinotracheale]
MGHLQGFELKKLEGGLGRISNNGDSRFLLIGAMPVDTTEAEHGQVYRLLQIEDAEKLGINESFDANKKVLAHYQISEVFRLAPDTDLFFLPLPAGAKLQDKATEILTTLRELNQVRGVAAFGFSNDLSSLAGEVETIQTQIVEEAKKDGILLDFILVEGKGKQGLSYSNLEDLKAKNAPQISLVIGQDSAVATLDDAYKYHACVGSALGMLSVRSVAENIGSVDIENKPDTARTYNTYSLTDEGLKKFIKVALSTGENINEISTQSQQDLNNKGYIFAGTYVDVAGFYFSNSHTCVSKSSDFTYIENNRVWNKAARLVRAALTPRIKSKLKKDPQTGYLKASTTAYLENLAQKAIEQMQIADEISGYSVYINPKQIVSETEALKVKISIVVDPILHKIEGEIGLTQNL